MSSITPTSVFFLLCLLASNSGAFSKHDDLIQRVSESAREFLSSLSDEQRGSVLLSFEGNERYSWNYVPKQRKGISLKSLDESQKELLERLLRTVLSDSGRQKVKGIIGLEQILFEQSGGSSLRDPEKYYLSLFGSPGGKKNWGMRYEGHHLSLNFTFGSGGEVSVTPQFFGANPANATGVAGFAKDQRVLHNEEQIAREFMATLNDEQRRKVVVSDRAYREIITGSLLKVEPLESSGISLGELETNQLELVTRLIHIYLSSLETGLANSRWEKIESDDLDEIRFSWAGSLEKGDGHYYRIQGESFLIEYDNVQNRANHIHAVWRDFEGDFGRDFLREHYENHEH
ncbi:DUF3500 domain-containing protein [Puniceicoccaceae bacterium K14]|nr:DUF3500 domain-containing protein [Puniceicoccaceae bacterium K14]